MTAPTAKSNGRKLTLAILAEAKRLPVAFLRELGLSDLPGEGVAIPYFDETGNELASKKRTALKAGDGTYWPKDTPLYIYGENRLDRAQRAGFTILVEGESDCWTLWHHGLPALGIPGSGAAKVLEKRHLECLDKVYIHREPDRGGEIFVEGITARLAALGF